MSGDLDELLRHLREFAAQRGWQRHHTPRNLILALASEVGELSAIFRWRDDPEVAALLRSEVGRASVGSEMADVLIFLIYLADACDVDLLQATKDKIEVNRRRF